MLLPLGSMVCRVQMESMESTELLVPMVRSEFPPQEMALLGLTEHRY